MRAVCLLVAAVLAGPALAEAPEVEAMDCGVATPVAGCLAAAKLWGFAPLEYQAPRVTGDALRLVAVVRDDEGAPVTVLADLSLADGAILRLEPLPPDVGAWVAEVSPDGSQVLVGDGDLPHMARVTLLDAGGAVLAMGEGPIAGAIQARIGENAVAFMGDGVRLDVAGADGATIAVGLGPGGVAGDAGALAPRLPEEMSSDDTDYWYAEGSVLAAGYGRGVERAALTLTAEGGAPRVLMSAPAPEVVFSNPLLSPDGRFAAAVQADRELGGEALVVVVDVAEGRAVFRAPARDPALLAWAADGRLVVLVPDTPDGGPARLFVYAPVR